MTYLKCLIMGNIVGIKPITPSSRMTAKEPQTDARKVRYGKPQEDSTTWK